MTYYITGDCHGDFSKIQLFCSLYNTSVNDVMIILGDAGFNCDLGIASYSIKRKAAKLPITFLCIHGNHEARPYEVGTYIEKLWNNGVVYVEEEFPNILFTKDGEVYTLDNKKCVAIGGAYSVDKLFRISMGFPWFESEQPSAETKRVVETSLDKHNWTVDFVFSHTCPLCYEPTDLFLDFIDQDEVDKSTEEWLSSIRERLNYKKWYFGHHHDNREFNDAEMLFEKIKELGTDKTMLCVGRPKYRAGTFVSFDFDNGRTKERKYGRIEVAQAYGSILNPSEVNYDIVDSEGVLNKHIMESDVLAFEEV